MAESRDRDEFYIGYLADAPEGVARHVRSFVLALLVLSALSAVVLATSQRPFDVSFFEFGAPRQFTGTVILEPYPMLQVERPDAGDGGGVSHYYVVAFGKFGGRAALEPFAGQRVTLEGTLIYRDDQTMIELVDGSVTSIGTAVGSGPSTAEGYGRMTLRGEIVDSKCYLGVMKPGHHKPHRACASLCIRGGIPPIFVPYAEDPVNGEGEAPADHLLLVGPDRQALSSEVLDWVAEPVEITGQVHRMDDVWMLQADPQTFRRLAEN